MLSTRPISALFEGADGADSDFITRRRARGALLDGLPRLVAEDKDRVAIVFSVSRDGCEPAVNPSLNCIL